MVTYFLNKEMQMNESADENESLVSASGTSHVYPTWEAKEVADAIDRIRRKRRSSGTILEGPDRLPLLHRFTPMSYRPRNSAINIASLSNWCLPSFWARS